MVSNQLGRHQGHGANDGENRSTPFQLYFGQQCCFPIHKSFHDEEADHPTALLMIQDLSKISLISCIFAYVPYFSYHSRGRLSPMSVADPLSFLDTHWIGRMGLTSGGLEDSLGAGGNSLSGLQLQSTKSAYEVWPLRCDPSAGKGFCGVALPGIVGNK